MRSPELPAYRPGKKALISSDVEAAARPDWPWERARFSIPSSTFASDELSHHMTSQRPNELLARHVVEEGAQRVGSAQRIGGGGASGVLLEGLMRRSGARLI